jgi:SAM-dependent methyltransferase
LTCRERIDTLIDMAFNWDSTRRVLSQSQEVVQRENRAWWSRNPMAYDWHGELNDERFSPAWFEKIDARFIATSALFATESRPFDQVIPFDKLAGKDVLEIGCGMGLHSELIVRAGARLTAIDLSPTSVAATTSRFNQKGLSATIMEADAEKLPFPDRSFDFVWSWGVIHHSSRTARIVRTISQVLRPDGGCRIMVYNREALMAWIVLVRDHLLRGGFLKQSFDETLWRSTDGFTARFYVKEQFEDFFRAFFSDVSSVICGQEADALPLPRQLRKLLVPFIPRERLVRAQAQRGSFIFLTASGPT